MTDMEIKRRLGEPHSIANWLSNCCSHGNGARDHQQRNAQNTWLVFKDDTAPLTLQTPLYSVLEEEELLSSRSFEDFEASMINSGYSYFIDTRMLGRVIDTLTVQKTDYTDQELFDAVLFYFEQDVLVGL
ncbi:DUF7716 domain-containing protein [Oceanospirillum maris]|uniref:DUF7716 domain-containing protein n=1 Tax=Oceanospirillum maris TaxID=64977 RepID=UPI0003FED055|nr:hypothetical protein [Oceanospirillum maris]